MTTRWTIAQIDDLHRDARAARAAGDELVTQAQAEATRLVAEALGRAELDVPATALLFAIRAATPSRGMLLNDMLALGRAMGLEEPAAWRDAALALLTATGRAKKVGARYLAPGWGA